MKRKLRISPDTMYTNWFCIEEKRWYGWVSIHPRIVNTEQAEKLLEFYRRSEE